MRCCLERYYCCRQSIHKEIESSPQLRVVSFCRALCLCPCSIVDLEIVSISFLLSFFLCLFRAVRVLLSLLDCLNALSFTVLIYIYI